MNIHQLNSRSATGLYSFATESNSFYEIKISKNKKTLTRIPHPDNSEGKLRKDNQELKIIGEFSIVVGEPAVFILEALGTFGNSTIRKTTIVKEICYIH